MLDPRCVCLICHHAVDNLNDCWVCDACDLTGADWDPSGAMVHCELCSNTVYDGAPVHYWLYGHPPVVGGAEVPVLRRAWRRSTNTSAISNKLGQRRRVIWGDIVDQPFRGREVMDERGEWWRIG